MDESAEEAGTPAGDGSGEWPGDRSGEWPGDGSGEDIAALASELEGASHAVALTGAGVSTASGIPDFRSDDGLWERFDPAEFHYQRFTRDPAGFWELRAQLYDEVFADVELEPNAAHEALAALENLGFLDAVITQNIDGLHQAAGSDSVVEIHGNTDRAVCEDCTTTEAMAGVLERIDSGDLPPQCSNCDGVLKPDVVLFGERLPEAALQQAQDHARDADVFLAVGSSLVVEPAASLPHVGVRTGATLALFNLEETPVSGRADYDFREDVTTTLPKLAEGLSADFYR